MTRIDWRIPPSIHHWLAKSPSTGPLVLLLRHSVRDDLPPGSAGYAFPITEIGERLARELGARLGGRLRSLQTSPLTRCVQTADALRAGAGVDTPVERSPLLGDPGVFVIDGHRAWPSWQALGHEGMMAKLVAGDQALPGMADADRAARFLVRRMLAVAGDRPGVHAFVTHDSLVTATAARLLGVPLGMDAWPWFLEGAFFWRDGGSIHVAYRQHHTAVRADALCSLDERGVIDFARREMAATLGSECEARFFLAGGAFKSLITGLPPRDLDVWCPSAEDRARVVATLEGRGARALAPRPYSNAFEIAGRVVEVPYRAEPATLEDRLGRFDLALSAVGAEHRAGDEWRAVVHPLARASVERREVLLLEPLVNWKYALATLDRARRYARELGYRVPLEAEAVVWRTFEAQPPEMRQGMINRFDRSAVGGHGVREEAVCRLR